MSYTMLGRPCDPSTRQSILGWRSESVIMAKELMMQCSVLVGSTAILLQGHCHTLISTPSSVSTHFLLLDVVLDAELRYTDYSARPKGRRQR